MLACGHHACRLVLALQPADVGHSKLRDQQRVFPKGLFDTSPTRVTGDIEHRPQALTGPDRQHLLADFGSHLFDQGQVPTAGQTNHLREGRPSQPHVAQAAFLVQDGRNTQAGLFD